ncbi:hypothetical protein [Aphanothece sacrum]|uniref:Uncharacterized protein n=1 Tax=Aphanothece sacrum FPU1 TaxID=1920663 RepID=A0A401IFZ3_APHSA|nr:hypothetical protein [Aphanothece sacrum]GBF80136.1 hypothetical protein AsFPU1_1537 [Aphanothece sacrum FPU1]
MVTTINLKITIETLTDTICSLDLEQKRQLLEILEQKIFEEEEAAYEDDAETIAELQGVHTEYQTGEYLTLDQYLAKNKASAS